MGLLRFVSLKFDSGRWYRKTRYPNVHTLFTRCIHSVCTIWSIHTKQEPIFALATLLVFVHTGDGLAADSSFGNIRLARKMTRLVIPQFSLPAKQIKFLSTEIILYSPKHVQSWSQELENFAKRNYYRRNIIRTRLLAHAGSQVHRNSTPLYFKFFFFSGFTSLHLTNLFRFKVSQAFPS